MSELRTQLFVVQHGETDWDQTSTIQGTHDTALSQWGVEQISRLRRAFTVNDFDVFYSSDLRRAQETAALLNEQVQLDVQTDPRLRERSYGHFQGLSLEQIQDQYPDQYQAYRSNDPEFSMTDGQSRVQLFSQVQSFLGDLIKRHPQQRVLAVSHGGTIQSLVHAVLGIPLAEELPLSCESGSVHAFEFEAGRWILRHWNKLPIV